MSRISSAPSVVHPIRKHAILGDQVQLRGHHRLLTHRTRERPHQRAIRKARRHEARIRAVAAAVALAFAAARRASRRPAPAPAYTLEQAQRDPRQDPGDPARARSVAADAPASGRRWRSCSRSARIFQDVYEDAAAIRTCARGADRARSAGNRARVLRQERSGAAHALPALPGPDRDHARQSARAVRRGAAGAAGQERLSLGPDPGRARRLPRRPSGRARRAQPIRVRSSAAPTRPALRARPRRAAPPSGARRAPPRAARPPRRRWPRRPDRASALRPALFGRLCRRDGPRPRPAQRGGRPRRGRATRNSPAICATAPATCSPTITNRATPPGSPGVSATSTPRSAPTRPMTTNCSAPALSIRSACSRRGPRKRRRYGAACRGCRRSRMRCPTTGTSAIREDIPVGVYDVIADFGQSRGGNTATILPNEPLYAAPLRAHDPAARQHHALAGNLRRAAAPPGGRWWRRPCRSTSPPIATFYRTLWHEVGHYLGVDRTARRPRARRRTRRRRQPARGDEGGPRLALRRRRSSGAAAISPTRQLRSHYASGIIRTLQNVRPRREQPYQTMQLMQLNWFLDAACCASTATAGGWRSTMDAIIDAVQRSAARGAGAPGPRRRGARPTPSSPAGAAGTRICTAASPPNMRAQQRYRYRLFTYAALDG